MFEFVVYFFSHFHTREDNNNLQNTLDDVIVV